jgi:hypothetical protein
MRRGNPRDEGDDEAFDDDLADEESSSDFDTLVDDLGGDVRNVGRRIKGAVTIEWLRFKTLAVDGVVKWALFILIFGFFLAVFISAGAFVAQGVRDLLGNFAAGFAILGVLLSLGLVLRMILRKQGLRQARAAFTEGEEDRSNEPT